MLAFGSFILPAIKRKRTVVPVRRVVLHLSWHSQQMPHNFPAADYRPSFNGFCPFSRNDLQRLLR